MKPNKPICNVATLIERYFTERLMRQRNVSANTIASYRDTFRLLFSFAQTRLRKPPSALSLGDLDAPFIGAFLADLETTRGAAIRTRNLRLTAIRSFFRFVSFEEPAHSAMIQRVLAIPSKRHDRRQVHFLGRRTRSDDVARASRSHPAAGRGPDGLAPVRVDRPRQGRRPPRRRRPRAMCRQRAEGTMHAVDHTRSTCSPVMAQGAGAEGGRSIVPQRARWPAQRR